jgi:hypothetical protein
VRQHPWRAVVHIRTRGLQDAASNQILAALESMMGHCKGQLFPKVRFPESRSGGWGLKVERYYVKPVMHGVEK